jgi:isopentenyl diphosphate isomerase/L-lactate dehydrogenase-like FMN-dependent dehydrogenase
VNFFPPFAILEGWEPGVAKVIKILQREFQMAMVLRGRTDIGSIDRLVIW